jgi:hypothetical protein
LPCRRAFLVECRQHHSNHNTREADLLPSYLGFPWAILANQGMYHYLHFILVTLVSLLCVELSIETLLDEETTCHFCCDCCARLSSATPSHHVCCPLSSILLTVYSRIYFIDAILCMVILVGSCFHVDSSFGLTFGLILSDGALQCRACCSLSTPLHNKCFVSSIDVLFALLFESLAIYGLMFSQRYCVLNGFLTDFAV